MARETRRIDLKLELGAVETKVEVKAGAAQIEIEAARIAAVAARALGHASAEVPIRK